MAMHREPSVFPGHTWAWLSYTNARRTTGAPPRTQAYSSGLRASGIQWRPPFRFGLGIRLGGSRAPRIVSPSPERHRLEHQMVRIAPGRPQSMARLKPRLLYVRPLATLSPVPSNPITTSGRATALRPSASSRTSGVVAMPCAADDVTRLSGRDETGIPRGLRRCCECGLFRGDYLALDGEGNGDPTPRVVSIHCRCENHNRCARCGSLLSDRRLSAYFFDEPSLSVRYVAAHAALGHRCA